MMPFTLTPLVDAPSANLPNGFNVEIALILAQSAALTYEQLLTNVQSTAHWSTLLTPSQLSALNTPTTNYTFTQLGGSQPPFIGSESLGLGFGPTDPGAFVTIPFGFAVQASDSSGAPQFNVVALRGTQTYEEWVADVDVVPVFPSLFNVQGAVHGGIYSVYTMGTDGAQPPSATSRAAGSLAQQLSSLLTSDGWNPGIPLYFTGHSLGAALAVLAAMDAATNFSSTASSIYMYNFAPPNIAVPTGILQGFAGSFQTAVPNSYTIVNSADIVPTLPPQDIFTLAIQDLNIAVTVGYVQAVAAPNIISYCAQLQDIGSNHSLLNNYLPFVVQLQGGPD